MLSRAILWAQHACYIQDNLALLQACENHQEIVIVYNIDTSADYCKSSSKLGYPQLRYQLQTVKSFAKSLGGSLLVRSGYSTKSILSLARELNVNTVYVQQAYAPYWQKTYQEISDSGLELKIINNRLSMLSKPYKVFTPFYNEIIEKNLLIQPVDMHLHRIPLTTGKLDTNIHVLDNISSQLPPLKYSLPEGEQEAWHGLRAFMELRLHKYHLKDCLYSDYSSQMSIYIANGAISIRKVCSALAAKGYIAKEIVRQLIWHDYCQQWLKQFPQLSSQNYQKRFDNIAWHQKKSHQNYQKWCHGTTGHKLVDAIMTQLNQSHYINNRARMIVASFLVKYLHCHWKLGASYFQKKLLDYDVANNSFNWQYQASAIAGIYLRRFNINRQIDLYDPKGYYVNLWLPSDQNIKPCDTYTIKQLSNFYEASKDL